MTLDQRLAARASFDAVFRRFEPYGCPFQPPMPGRLLIFEVDRRESTEWGLNAAGLRALLDAASDRDLARVFISAADPQDRRYDLDHYVLSPLNVDSYTHPPPGHAWPIVPNALYPSSGTWGVISSDESHALAGGSERFVADLLAGLGRSQEEMIAGFLEHWAEFQDDDPDGDLRIGDWIPAQLAHVVGRERAEAALGASRLRRWDLPP